LEVDGVTHTRNRVAYVGLAASLLLAFLGAQRFASDIQVAVQRDTLVDLQDNKPRDPADIKSLVEAEKFALSVGAPAQSYSDLSLAEATLASSTADTAEKQALLADARDTLRTGLQREPANPYAWLRLALLSRGLGAPDAEIYKYWQMSIMTGPNEDKILAPRIDLAVDLWPLLGNSDRQAVFADIRDIYDHDHGWQIANEASPFMVNVIRAALVTDMARFKEYDAFEKARQLRIKDTQAHAATPNK